jgi:simple sugar transport system substrate-binding protein
VELPDPFSDILQKGALQAAAELRVQIWHTSVSSAWDFPTMVQKFAEEIAKKPDAISFMGHPGDAAILPLMKKAKERATWWISAKRYTQSDDLINGGFTGANLELMGNLLAARAVKDFGLKKGDGAIVVGTFGSSRSIRSRRWHSCDS